MLSVKAFSDVTVEKLERKISEYIYKSKHEIEYISYAITPNGTHCALVVFTEQSYQ